VTITLTNIVKNSTNFGLNLLPIRLMSSESKLPSKFKRSTDKINPTIDTSKRIKEDRMPMAGISSELTAILYYPKTD